MKLILAIDEKNAIGYKGDQLYYIKEDLKHFKKLTNGKTLVMGRKTLDALGGPLKGRDNLILSRSKHTGEGLKFFKDKASLLDYLNGDSDKAFIIGGAGIVDLFLDQIDEAYITKIYDNSKPADTFLHDFARDPDFILSEKSEIIEEDGLSFQYLLYRRKK